MARFLRIGKCMSGRLLPACQGADEQVMVGVEQGYCLTTLPYQMHYPCLTPFLPPFPPPFPPPSLPPTPSLLLFLTPLPYNPSLPPFHYPSPSFPLPPSPFPFPFPFSLPFPFPLPCLALPCLRDPAGLPIWIPNGPLRAPHGGALVIA